jgi:hypothetical protein
VNGAVPPFVTAIVLLEHATPTVQSSSGFPKRETTAARAGDWTEDVDRHAPGVEAVAAVANRDVEPVIAGAGVHRTGNHSRGLN